MTSIRRKENERWYEETDSVEEKRQDITEQLWQRSALKNSDVTVIPTTKSASVPSPFAQMEGREK